MKRYIIRRNGVKVGACVVARSPEDALRFARIRNLKGITITETCWT
jgi:hypothetical protein